MLVYVPILETLILYNIITILYIYIYIYIYIHICNFLGKNKLCKNWHLTYENLKENLSFLNFLSLYIDEMYLKN